jgi:hypothetical protein
LDEQEQLELFRQEEEKRLRAEQNERWLREEQLAQERWRKQQKRLERLKAERAKQEVRFSVFYALSSTVCYRTFFNAPILSRQMVIKEEWEREQQKLREEAEAREREEKRREREQVTEKSVYLYYSAKKCVINNMRCSLAQAELLERIEQYVTGESDRLPSSARTVTETQPGFEECPFFSKVAACRFRDDCSR